MLPIKEQISSVYRNKSSITFLHVRVYRGFMCFSGKKRKYSCFAGNNSLFYVLFSLTVIALTWKLSWHFVGNKNVKKNALCREFHRPGPQFIICGRRHRQANSRAVYQYSQQNHRKRGYASNVPPASPSLAGAPSAVVRKKQLWQFEKTLRKLFLVRRKPK